MTEENNQESNTETPSRKTGFDELINNDQGFYGYRRWAVIVGVLLVIMVSWFSVIDRKTQHYVDDATVQALAAYGTLRLSNAAVSLVSSAEMDAQIASVRVGAALDPAHDLIEDGSNVLKMAVGSLVTQKLMIEIVSTSFFKILLTITGLLLVGSLFIQAGRYSGFCMKAFALAGLARFLFVLVIFLNGMADQAFVEEKTEATRQNLKATSEKLSQVPQKAGGGLSKKERTEIQSRIEALTTQRASLMDSIIQAEEAVTEADSELKASQAELSKIQENKGLVEQYFPEDSEHQALVKRVGEAEQTYDRAIAELDGYTGELSEVNEEISALKATMRGEDKGWMAAATERMSAVKEMLDVSAVKDRTEAMVDSTLRLMALFTLKTVIIPIIFLVLLLKGFHYIWGIDARALAARQWKRAKAEST